jgi:hypothetical protein
MPFEIDVSVVATLLLAVLILAYGMLLGALAMWIGRRDEPAPVATRAADPSALRQAA